MPFKINISEKSGKTYKLELDSEALVGKSLGEKVFGEEVSPDLAGYELVITGASSAKRVAIGVGTATNPPPLMRLVSP